MTTHLGVDGVALQGHDRAVVTSHAAGASVVLGFGLGLGLGVRVRVRVRDRLLLDGGDVEAARRHVGAQQDARLA